MIGLLDYDYLHHHKYPNLELMKYAARYKNDGVRLITDPNKLSGYSKVEAFCYVTPVARIPKTILFSDGVDWHPCYMPSDIDAEAPDPTIYKEELMRRYTTVDASKHIVNFLMSNYVRRELGTSRLREKQNTIVYDTEFFTEGWEDWSEKNGKRRIRFAYPVELPSMEVWDQYRSMSRFFHSSNQFILYIPLVEDFKRFINSYHPSPQLYFRLGGDDNSMRDALNFLYIAWSQEKNIQFKVLPQSYYPYPNLIELIKGQPKHGNETLLARANKKTREEMQLFIKVNPGTTSLFTQTYQELAHKGYWREL